MQNQKPDKLYRDLYKPLHQQLETEHLEVSELLWPQNGAINYWFEKIVVRLDTISTVVVGNKEN